MDNVEGPIVIYRLRANDIWWDGDIEFHSLPDQPSRVEFYLPPACRHPSFRLRLNGKEPSCRSGRQAIFDGVSGPAKFSFQLCVPPVCTFNQLSDLLPEIVLPEPTALSLETEPPPTKASLEVDGEERKVCSVWSTQFFSSLVSFNDLGRASQSCGSVTIDAYCSPRFQDTPQTLVDHSASIYQICADWLGESGYRRFSLYFDWTERYLEKASIASWNSGGDVYLQIAGLRVIVPILSLTLAHEMVHEWNGRRIHPASEKEWWFLEGVTQLLSFQIVWAGGFIDSSYLVELFTEALDASGSDPISEASPLAFDYPRSLQYAFRIEKLLRQSGKEGASLLFVLRELLATCNGAAFTEEAIRQILSRYIDLESLDKSSNAPPPDAETILALLASPLKPVC